MTTAKSIAGLIGPALAAIALGILLNLASFPALAEQVSREPALIFLSGLLLFVAGLAIVRVHNVWSGGWPVLVTILGWLALIGGLIRILLPTKLAEMAAGFGQNTGLITASAIVLLVAGGFLSFKAYGSE
jgi:hypothetical protein